MHRVYSNLEINKFQRIRSLHTSDKSHLKHDNVWALPHAINTHKRGSMYTYTKSQKSPQTWQHRWEFRRPSLVRLSLPWIEFYCLSELVTNIKSSTKPFECNSLVSVNSWQRFQLFSAKKLQDRIHLSRRICQLWDGRPDPNPNRAGEEFDQWRWPIDHWWLTNDQY